MLQPSLAYKGTKATLVLSLWYFTLLKLPYIYISITFAFRQSKYWGVIIWSVIDMLTWLLALPVFLICHGKGPIKLLPPLLVTWAGIASQVALITYELDERDRCTRTDFWQFNCYISTTLNIVFIVLGFGQPVFLTLYSLFNMTAEPNYEEIVKEVISESLDEGNKRLFKIAKLINFNSWLLYPHMYIFSPK